MQEIGTFEAKNKLASLLDKVEEGESFTITRRGKPVAQLVPIAQKYDPAKAQEVIEGIRVLRESAVQMSREEIVHMIKDEREERADKILAMPQPGKKPPRDV